MLLLIFNLLLSVILIGVNPTIVIAPNMTHDGPGNNNTDYGGLSAESIEIAEANKTDLIRNATTNNGTDFGGLSARSVNISN